MHADFHTLNRYQGHLITFLVGQNRGRVALGALLCTQNFWGSHFEHFGCSQDCRCMFIGPFPCFALWLSLLRCAPPPGNGTAMHAVRLAQISNDSMMQRSAADRVASLAINRASSRQALDVEMLYRCVCNFDGFRKHKQRRVHQSISTGISAVFLGSAGIFR